MENLSGARYLAHLDELPDPGSRGFDPWETGRDTFFVVRRGREIYGWRNACPHYGSTPMAWQRHAYLNGDSTRVMCHSHGAQFDMETGECLLGPCLGQSLQRIDVYVCSNNRIWLLEDGDILASNEEKSS